MKDFVIYIIRSLAEYPKEISVTEVAGGQTTILELHCHPKDVGRLIAFAGADCKEIVVDGHTTRFADRDLSLIVWAPMNPARQVPGGALLQDGGQAEASGQQQEQNQVRTKSSHKFKALRRNTSQAPNRSSATYSAAYSVASPQSIHPTKPWS